MAKLKKCAHCGKMFKPEKASQMYCSLDCAEAAIAKRKQWNDVMTPMANVIELEYLTFSKAAALMGCSRQYVYKLVAEGKLPASRLSNRMSFIKREDIDKMLQGNPYYRVLPVGMKRARKDKVSDANGNTENNQQVSEFDANKYISLEEAMKFYGVCNTTIYNKVKTNHVPQCRIHGKTYYDRNLLDEVMQKYKAVTTSTVSSDNNTEEANLDNMTIVRAEGADWLLIKDCATLYHKSLSAMKTFAYRYEVPARWIDSKRYYSKNFLDSLLNKEESTNSDYYTISDLYNKFGISKGNAVKYCERQGIRIKKENRTTLFLKTDVEKLLK